MEKSINRSSYRRSARNNYYVEEKNKEEEIFKDKRKNKITNMLLNQSIVSLLMMIGILTAQYFDVQNIVEWVKENMSHGYTMTEIIAKLNEHTFSNHSNLYNVTNTSGDYHSGENSGDKIKQEIVSGEKMDENGYLNAVEGVNQMADDASEIKTKYSLQIPLRGIVTSQFGSRVSDNSIVSPYHAGLDIAANTGTEILAAHDGKVLMAKNYSTYGNCVMIENEKLITVYAHCSALLVSEGQIIKQGNKIAKVGMTGNATGPHLHFEIRYEGRFVDPQKVLDF